MNDNQNLHEELNWAWLNLGDVNTIDTQDVLAGCATLDELEAAFNFVKIVSDPEYLHLFCKEILNIQLAPHQCVVLKQLWTHAYPMLIASRGFSKTFLLAIYCILRCILVPGHKVILTGAGFRQSKIIFEYIEQIWNNSPVLRDICNKNSGTYKESDRWRFQINQSVIIAIPLGDGSKIRGLRANTIICDEFSSIDVNIYETVVQGFAVVETAPVEKMKEAGRRKILIDRGVWNDEEQKIYETSRGNQSIIAGTAGYDFEHFASYWKDYQRIITQDIEKIREISEKKGGNVNPADFCVIRYPYELIPEGFMDDKLIAKTKATINSSTALMEYGAVFVKDSDGYFRRTLIESCVCNDRNKICTRDFSNIVFKPLLVGDRKKRYVMGVDPASEKDNLAIVILECYADHWRIVYCWTTNAKKHQLQLKAGVTEEENYYAYCCRKIRDLMQMFPMLRIGIDGQGGGKAIIEALHEKSLVKDGESLLWPIIDPEDPKETDLKPGLHIIEKVEFADADWTSRANHGLRTDFEMKYCLFPQYDHLSLSLAAEHDLELDSKNISHESMEDSLIEIEQLKDELSSIVMSRTATGRDRWDTPEIKLASGKKGRQRKDRYSALVIANMVAREMNRAEPATVYAVIGGTARDIAAKEKKNTNQSKNLYNRDWASNFKAVQRR